MNLQKLAEKAARLLYKTLQERGVRQERSVQSPSKILYVAMVAEVKEKRSQKEFMNCSIRPAISALAKAIKGLLVLHHRLSIPDESYGRENAAIGEFKNATVRLVKAYQIRNDTDYIRLDIGITTFTKKGTIRKK